MNCKKVFMVLLSVTGAGIVQSVTIGWKGRGIGDSIPGRGKKFLSFSQSAEWLWGRPTSHQMGNRGSFYGVKRQGSENNFSPPCNVEVKNGGARPPFFIRLHGVEHN
jgi:hypothetical protein